MRSSEDDLIRFHKLEDICEEIENTEEDICKIHNYNLTIYQYQIYIADKLPIQEDCNSWNSIKSFWSDDFSVIQKYAKMFEEAGFFVTYYTRESDEEASRYIYVVCDKDGYTY